MRHRTRQVYPRAGLVLLSVLAIAAFLAGHAFATDPMPPDCDVVVQFDGKIRPCGWKIRSLDEQAILYEACRKAANGIESWKARDADRFHSDTPADFSYKRPDGTAVTRGDMVADQRRRMGMTRSIDSIVVAVRIDTLRADSAIVRSRQWFSRVIAQPDSTLRRRFTGVTHREIWRKRADRWTLESFAEENQVARWVDEEKR